MMDIVFYIISFVFTMPIVASLGFFVFFKQTTKSARTAMNRTVKLSTIIFIMSVYFMIKEIFTYDVLGYLLVLILFIFVCIIIGQWRKNEEIRIVQAYRLLRKITFLVFLCLHIILVIVGITIKYISF